MRKVVSFFLLLIIAFNWLGYDLVISILNARANRAAERTIEKGSFDPQQLVEFKLDLQLPYATDWPAFEKVKGTVSIAGVMYNFVERKYEKGYMIYRCLPNHRGTELQSARDYFYSLVYDMEKDGKKEPVPSTTSFKKINIETRVVEKFVLDGLFTSSLKWNAAHRPVPPLAGYGNTPSQPPEA